MKAQLSALGLRRAWERVTGVVYRLDGPDVRTRFMLGHRGPGSWLTVSGRGPGTWATVAPVPG